MAEEKNQVKDNRIKSQKNEVSSSADTKPVNSRNIQNNMAEGQGEASGSKKKGSESIEDQKLQKQKKFAEMVRKQEQTAAQTVPDKKSIMEKKNQEEQISVDKKNQGEKQDPEQQLAKTEHARPMKTQDADKSSKKKKAKKKQNMQVVQFVLILALAVGIILAVYIRMTNQSKNSAQYAEENMTELSTLKLYNLDTNYPKNPRDVVKLHCRMLKCIYNEKLSNDDYEVLNSQIRKLFSEELLDANPETKNLESLKKEAKDFQNAGKIFISYTVDSESNVHYSTVDGVNYAIVLVNLNIKKSTVSDTLQEEYLLCKENGEWKIVGWQSVSAATISPAN